MNQILITGDEPKKKVKKEKKTKEKKLKPIKDEKEVLGINPIVIFYAICTIILGICIISGSIYVRGKINETVEANMKPSVEISKNEENETIEINVTHIRGIKTIAYKWNSEEETFIEGNNQKEITESINLKGGKNTLTVRVTEENGQSVTYKKEFMSGSIPEIELEAVANGIKLIATSKVEIEYITYSWDEEEEQKINVGQDSYEGIINAPKGQHTLHIEVADINGNVAIESRPVVGDTEPTVNVTADIIENKLIFKVAAEDDEQITTIEITHNNGEKQVIEVNEKTYYTEIEMTGGENRLLVVAYNKNGLYTEIGRIFRNQ